MKLSELKKLLCCVAAVHVLAVVGLIIVWDPRWLWLSLGAYIAFLWLGHDLYHHRYLSHRSFEMPLWIQRCCAVLGVFCLFGTPIGIAATHVRHHGFADTDKDPHPAHMPWEAWFWLSDSMERGQDWPTVRRLMQDAFLVWISKHYFSIYIGTASLLALIDARLAVYGLFVPVVYAFFSNGLVNVVCHKWGSRRFSTADNSRNNHFVNSMLLFSGIAMHNNHHAKPSSPSCSFAWYEVDLIAKIIRLVRSDKNRIV